MSWKSVFQHKKTSVIFGSILIMLLISAFSLVSWQFSRFSEQVKTLTAEGEIIVEIDQNLGEEGIKDLEESVKKFPMVEGVEYWAQDRTETYIDRIILPGYRDFLLKTGAEVPVKPLLRIQISDLNQRAELEKLLDEQFGNLITLGKNVLPEKEGSFATRFIEEISKSIQLFRALIILQLVIVLGVGGYLLLDLIAERKRGFHFHVFPVQGPAFAFFPAFLLFSGFFLAIILVATGVASFILGHVLLGQAVVLFILFELLAVIFLFRIR
jgi:hypothetical protein